MVLFLLLLFYLAISFMPSLFPDATISEFTREVASIDFLLEAMDVTTKKVKPLSYEQEYGECLFSDDNGNRAERIQF